MEPEIGHDESLNEEGIAFDLLKKYPKLARETNEDRENILARLANKPMAFETGCRLGRWEYLIYNLIPVSVKEEHDIPHTSSVYGDIENPGERPEPSRKIGFLQESLLAAIANEDEYYFYDLAITYRHEKVFSLIYDYTSIMAKPDLTEKMENKLHLAGRLMPSSQVSGAALQMQRELQWFKAVENILHRSFQEQRNPEGQTPRAYFTEEHKNLVKEGEKWKKNTASSCTVVAALIVTIVFTAAFTVPGGNDSRGIPNFLHEPAFVIFALSDAFALFFSTTSMLMFLGILTSRYAEEDFLESLRKKLIIGLFSLFLSIASMMIAFGAAIYIVLSPLWSMVFIPIAILGGLTVILFAELQFPLLFN